MDIAKNDKKISFVDTLKLYLISVCIRITYYHIISSSAHGNMIKSSVPARPPFAMQAPLA